MRVVAKPDFVPERNGPEEKEVARFDNPSGKKSDGVIGRTARRLIFQFFASDVRVPDKIVMAFNADGVGTIRKLDKLKPIIALETKALENELRDGAFIMF